MSIKRMPVYNPTSPFANSSQIRFAIISDTHTSHRQISLPAADVLLHCGDFTFNGRHAQVKDFADWLKELKGFKAKVLIAGNHDFTFDVDWYRQRGSYFHNRDIGSLNQMEAKFQEYFLKNGGLELFSQGPMEHAAACKKLLDCDEMRTKHGVWYLEDSGVDVSKTLNENGDSIVNVTPITSSGPSPTSVRIWGSPWSPDFHSWAFMLPRRTGALASKYELISPKTHILLSHTPPYGVLDESKMTHENVGAEELTEFLEKREDLSVVAFGHIHEDYGVVEKGGRLFLNAAMSEVGYDCGKRMVHVVDL